MIGMVRHTKLNAPNAEQADGNELVLRYEFQLSSLAGKLGLSMVDLQWDNIL